MSKSSILILIAMLFVFAFFLAPEKAADSANAVVDVAVQQGSTTAAWGALVVLAAPMVIIFFLFASALSSND